MATESNIEIRSNGKRYATRNFYQGEVVVDSLKTLFYSSSDPNVVIRNGRIIAFKCITSGDELTIRAERDG